MLCGSKHSSNGPPSRRHSKVRTSSFALKAKLALRSWAGLSGTSSKLTTGATVSMAGGSSS